MKVGATLATISLCFLLAASRTALAWGDDGHKAIALIAEPCLMPETRQAVAALLESDTDNRTPHDIASEATWADKYRDANNRRDHYEATKYWHFTDIEIDKPDLTQACFGRQPLPKGTLASNGPPQACAVDKIKQFEAELGSPTTDAEERLFALKFLLHLIGDVHQPLHSSDNHDHGGNDVKITVDGFPHKPRDELHSYWDTQFVDAISMPPAELARQLRSEIKAADAMSWATGTADDWAMETFQVGKADAYGQPPLRSTQPQHLNETYADNAEMKITTQLGRAGVRLAYVLNGAFGDQQTNWGSCLGGDR